VGSTGVFLGCSSILLPPKRAMQIDREFSAPGDEAVNVDEDDEQKPSNQ
jgi:hypothetical protein